jgi:glycerol-3-phosphate cytidylyltransferase
MNGRKYKIGYTTGVFDLFHIGHLNILRRAKDMCDFLIVGVSTDELVWKYKNKKPVIPYVERVAIVEAIKYVNKVVPQVNRDKIAAFEQYKFDAMFVGDDWKGDKLFIEVEQELNKQGANIVYLPYTNNLSSTLLNKVLEKINSEGNLEI